MLAPVAVWLSDLGAWTGRGSSLSSLTGLPSWLVTLAGATGFGLILYRLGLGRVAQTPGAWPWAITGSALGVLGVFAWMTGAQAGWHWGLSMTGPSRSLLEAGLSPRGASLNWGAAMLIGLVLGSWVSARLNGSAAWRTPTASELPVRFLGGVLMGAGGTLAGGCNIGNALTGLSILAVQSLIATVGIAVGAALALKASASRPGQKPPE